MSIKNTLETGKKKFKSEFRKININDINIENNVFLAENVQIFTSAVENIEIGNNTIIEAGCNLICDQLKIENNIIIKHDSDIRSKEINIGKNTTIDQNFNVLCPEKFTIGKNSNIGKNISIQCRSFEAGEFLQIYDRALVGKGGKFGVNSRVKVGNGCFIGKYSMINPSEMVEIGDDVGIGDEVQIWTHGGYLSTLDGFPIKFAPVKIGNHVWLPSRCIVLPGVTIGDNVVIGINSLVNKDLPPGCLAAGIPCKIIKKNTFPKKLEGNERKAFIDEVINRYLPIMKDKGINGQIIYHLERDEIVFKRKQKITKFNLTKMKIDGVIDEEIEDFRDFLRRNGIKFFTENKFKSIIPPSFKTLMSVTK